MPDLVLGIALVGGRLAIDFANLPSRPASGPSNSLSWEELIGFLKATRIVSLERAEELLVLTETDTRAAFDLLNRAKRLRDALRATFDALARKQRIPRESVEPINEVLRVTEGHDELVEASRTWRIEYIAREGGLDWLLAAVARSAAELVTEGEETRLRLCANPACSLFFYDNSRTHRRRWCSMSLCGNRHKVAAFARRHGARKRGN
ncbi:MAG TPA: CGNR zinc finger domain-containing protein [Candidatus Sulfotelmatobacter sp.]|nr:CGNR zinc finger domain-containing protein [Candidatus Sulfotelmatobacter sp.]